MTAEVHGAAPTAPTGVIDPRTSLDHVHLVVHSLDRVVPFYTDVLGFQVHRREDSPEGRFAALGAGRNDLLRLTEVPDAPRSERAASMYHMAFKVEQRIDLARWLRRITETRTPVEGLVHHAPAAEAIYLPDPEGNTVELNWDPPRELWVRPGQPPFIGNLPLDTDGLFALLEGQSDAWAGAPADTAFSHIHLYVGDLEAAAKFYEGVLGFERTAAMSNQAVFVSAGGYHHHVAFNVWKGRGIPPQPHGAAGLRYYVVRVPDGAEMNRVLGRVRAAGLATQETPETANVGTAGGVLLHDPAGLGVVLAPAVA
ncbi:MAG: VOC family protein [Chloroflexota bacterium]|nr:VOC family protein [Chloroflexota bacterium]